MLCKYFGTFASWNQVSVLWSRTAASSSTWNTRSALVLFTRSCSTQGGAPWSQNTQPMISYACKIRVSNGVHQFEAFSYWTYLDSFGNDWNRWNAAALRTGQRVWTGSSPKPIARHGAVDKRSVVSWATGKHIGVKLSKYQLICQESQYISVMPRITQNRN